jgi:putative transposase
VRFIDEHKQVFGVEPVCRVLSEHGLQIAPSTYYAAGPGRRRRGPCGMSG